MAEPIPGVAAADAPQVRTLVLLELQGGEALFETLSPGRAREVLASHDRLVRDLLGRFSGREVEKSRRFLLLFERPLEAVAFCLAWHAAVRNLSAEMGLPLQGRAALHLGEVFLWENPPEHVARGAKPLEIEGPSRTTVARVLSLARGGQTLLTQTAFDLARRAAVGVEALDGKVEWRSHGPYRFPRTGQLIDVFEVGSEASSPPVAPASDDEARSGIPEVRHQWRPEEGQPIPGRPHWLLKRRLEGTGFGEVWLARHPKTSERRAFHFCLDPAELPRMQRHLDILRRLREGDPGFTVRPLDSHLDEEPYFLESEHAGGDPLPAWAEARGGLARIPFPMRLDLVAQLAEALAAVHRLGISLGDLDPSTLLIVERPGGPPRLLLADLSRCRSAGEEGVAPPADLQALGIFLWQMSAGDLDRRPGPFWDREIEDGLLCEDLAVLLNPSPAAHFPDAAELARRLRTLEQRQSERRSDEERRRQDDEKRHARGRLVKAVALVALLLLIALAFLLGRAT